MQRVNFKIINMNKNNDFITPKTPKTIKVEIKKLSIKKENIERGNYTRGFQYWHTHIKYTNIDTGSSISISDSVGGCGVQHLYNWTNCYNRDDVEDLLKYIIKDLSSGVGLLSCQLGQDYKSCKLEQSLINNGFEAIEYNNYQHDNKGGYKGYFYLLKIKK